VLSYLPSGLLFNKFETLVKQILSEKLVPGDIVCIDPSQSQMLQFDAVLVEGSCSVDESILTGESNPITKVKSFFNQSMLIGMCRSIYNAGFLLPFLLLILGILMQIAIPSEKVSFDYMKHKRHILFCGTELLQGRCQSDQTYLKAVVVRTGIQTKSRQVSFVTLHSMPSI